MRTATLQPDAPRVGAVTAVRGRALPGWAAPLVLVALHVAIQLSVRPMPRWNDALMVMDFARRFPDLPDVYRFSGGAVEQHALRLGLILPARAFQEIFGYGQVAFYAFPFLAGVALVLATWWLGRMLFGRAGGAFAGALVVLAPVLVRTTNNNSSWQLLPDVPAAALFALGIALIVAAGRTIAADRAGTRGRAATWLLLGAGACFGWAYMCREFAVFLAPAVLAALLLWRVPWRRWWALAAPLVATLALELAWAAHLYGDPLARWRTASSHTYAPDEGGTRLHAATVFWRVLEHNPGAAVTAALMVAMLTAAAVVRRRGLVLAAVWFLSLWVPLTLLAGVIDPDHVSLRAGQPRYWLLALPATALGIAGAATLVAGRRPAPARAAAALAVAAVVLGFYAAGDARYIRNASLGSDEAGWTAARWSALRAYLHDSGTRIPAIASDGRTASTLDLMYRYAPLGGGVVWHGRVDVSSFRRRRNPPRPQALNGDALLWSQYTSRTPPSAGDGWREVWRSDNGALRIYLTSSTATRAGSR